MAKGFNLTAQINLQGPSNLKPVVAQIRRELGTISANVDVKLNAQSARSIDAISAKLKSMNAVLVNAKNNTAALNAEFRQLSSALSNAGAVNNKAAVAMTNVAKSSQAISQNIKQSSTEMQEFGKQSALAIRRFAAFSVVTGVVFKVINAINSAFTAFVSFDRELVKLQQVTGKSELGIKALEKQITTLSTSLGVSSESLMSVASTLAQAGLNAEETRIALAALAKTELAPSFDNLKDTTEGAIAALRQFGLQAKDLEAVLGSINAVAAAFAVESQDIITAIQRTGGVFASASKGVSQGKDALNEFIAVFTSVRATTRESAETIATGLRTIFTRIQRKGTIEALKEYGVTLTDLENKFVGPYEAVRRLSEGLKQLDPRDLRFSQIVEELGGFRQIGKVIPLIQQFADAQKALKVAQTGQSSLTDAQLTAQKSLANQLAKVREQFLALFREIGQSTTFKAITTIVLGLASAFINLASAFKPILPFLAILATIKGVKALGEFGTGFFGSIKKGGGAKAVGTTIGSGLTGTSATEKEKKDISNRATEAIRENTSAIKTLTTAMDSLTGAVKNISLPTKLNDGGKVLGFNKGGMVPGNGGGDTVPAYLEGGEIVMNRRAVKKYGADNLLKMNKYAKGGPATLKRISQFPSGKKEIPNYINKYSRVLQPDDKIEGQIERKTIGFKEIQDYYQSNSNQKFFKFISSKGKKYENDMKQRPAAARGYAFEDFIGEYLVKKEGLSGYRKTKDRYAPLDFVGGGDPIEVRFRKDITPDETILAKRLRHTIKYSGLPKQFTAAIDDKPPVNIGSTTVYQADPDYKSSLGFAFGGKVQKFAKAGKVEEYYGQAEVEAAKAAQEEYKKSIEKAFSFENLYFEVLEGKSIAEGIEPEVYGTGIGSLKKGEPGVIGTRKVRLSGAIRDDSSVNVAALDAMVENLRKSAFKAREAQQQVYTDAEASISAFKTSGLLENIDPSILKYIEDTIGQLQAGTVDPEIWNEDGAAGISLEDMKKKLTKSNLEAFANLMKGEQVKVQGQRTKLSEVFNSILETYGSNVSPVEQSNITSAVADKFIKSQGKDKLKKASLGGLIQKFMAGGAAEPLSPEELVSWIQELGQPQDVRGLAGGSSYIDSVLKGVAVEGKPASSKEIFSKNFILGARSDPYLTIIQDLLEIADKNKKRPRIFTEEEKANATKVGLVGMLPFGINDVSYEEIAGKILSIHTATLPKDKVPAVLQMRREIDEVLGRTTKALYGDPGQDLDDPTKEALGLGNLEGYMIEAILARAGANPGKLDDRSVDYSMGLGKAAGLFNIEPNIPTEIKRDVKSGLSKARSNFRNYFAKFAFGGKADGPGFEEVRKQIMDKYPEIDFRISKRKQGRGFGYNLLGALKTDGGLLQSKGLKFEQPSNLQKLIEASDKMATSLINPQGLSIGGSPSGEVTVPAMVSSGEAYIPPALAKKIGYGKLNQMNQADRNGMKGFAGGGVSVFKGPGSGTSDSIGPIGLPTGSFIIREKATKALGLHKNGGNISKFAKGGKLSKAERGQSAAERKQRKEAFLAEQRGGITREEAYAVGAPRPDFGAGASRKRDVMARPQGELNLAKIQSIVVDNYRLLYAQEKKRIDELYDARQAELEQEFEAGTINVSEMLSRSLKLSSEQRQAKGEAKTRLTAEAKQAQVRAEEEYKTGKQTPQIEQRKKDQTMLMETEVQNSMDAVVQEAKAKYQKLYDEELRSIKDLYKQKIKQAQDEGKDVGAIIAEYRGVVADAKKSMETGLRTEVAEKQAQLPETIAANKRSQVEQLREDKARASDPFYEAKRAADLQKEQAKASPFGMGPEDPKARSKRQQQFADEEYFKYKAEQQGTTVQAYKLSQAQQLGKASYQNRKFYGGKLTEARSSLAARRDTAMKIGGSIKQAEEELKVAPAGSAEAAAAATKLADAQSRLAAEQEGILQQMIALRPDLAATDEGMKELAAGAKKTADALKTGDLEQAQAELTNALGESVTAAEAMEISIQNFAKETNQDAEMLKRQFGQGAGAKMLQAQEFAQSREGQRFGIMAQFAPGALSKFSKTGVGQALGKAADFTTGKGGAISQLFAKVGGIQGVGAGLTVASGQLQAMLPKSISSNPNVAGGFGAVSGAGTGAASAAMLASQLDLGPIATLVAAIGGSIVGGIEGFFGAKNQAIITNALENIAKSTGDLETAFKKLESSMTASNLANAQKEFGKVLSAQNDIDKIAFGSSLTGENALRVAGTTAGGAITGGAIGGGFGALAGGAIGTFFGGPVGTVIGAKIGAVAGTAIGGAIAGYMSTANIRAEKGEALKARIGQSGENIKAATRFAEIRSSEMSTEDLTKVYESLKAGSNELNPLVKQYQEGAIKAAEANGKLTAKQIENIKARELERAAIDAYIQKRKQAGGTDEQIQKEIEKDRASAIQEGKEKIRIDGELLAKQLVLARATKEVTLATEGLLDVYRRVTSKAQRFSDEIGDILNINQATLSDLSGKSEVSKVDRRGAERVLGNISAYSAEEVKAATQEVVGKLGGGEDAQALGKQAEAAKFLQDKLPAMLRARGANATDIMDSLRNRFKDMGLTSGAVNKMLADIEVQLSAERKGGLGSLASEIEKGGIDQISNTAQEALKTMQNLAKTYNDALDKTIELQNQYNESIMQADEYLRKAGSIRINAELDLAKALGRSPTLQELNQPFDFEIKDLTKRLIPGGTTDPTEIANGIIAATRQNRKLEAANVTLSTTGMQGAVGANTGADLLKEQQANIAAIGANNVAINQSRQALERLANDGTKAANALAKIQEEQQALEGFAAFAQNVFTAEPQQLAKMEIEAAALNAAQAAGPEFMQSRFNRQQAFAGLEQAKGFLTPQEFRDAQADLIKKSFQAQGFQGGDVVKKIGGKEFTLDQLVERMRGGVSELDPNVIAYREAVDTQIKANEQLARLEEIKSLQIQDAMLRLQEFLANEFPRILTEAVKEAKTDAATQPEVGATEAEKSKAEANKKYEEAGKKKQKIDQQIANEEKKLKEAESKVGWEQGASTEVAMRKRKIKELQAQAAEEQRVMDESKAEFVTASSTVAEEQKAKEEAKAAQAAEEKKAREAKVTEAKETSAAARFGGRPAVIQAPPPPGTVSSERAEVRRQIEEKQAEMANTEARTTAQTAQETKPTVSTYGGTQVDPITQEVLKSQRTAEQERLDELARSKASKEKELRKKEKTLKASRIAAVTREGGPESSPRVQEAQAAYDMAKADMESINQQMAATEEKIGNINSQLSGSSRMTQEERDMRVADPSSIVSSQGIPSSGRRAVTDGRETYVMPAEFATSGSANQPVPSNIPRPVEYTRQVQAAETAGSTQTAKPTETTGQLLTLDPASLKGLNDFNTTFGSYVDKLVAFQFPVIPDKIELNHNVQIDMTGAASINTLEKRLQELAVALVMPKIEELRNETSAATDGRVKASGAKGVKK